MSKAPRKSQAELREERWGQPIPEGLKHGRGSMAYRHYGCDCSVCLPSGKRHDGSRTLSPSERSRRLRERLKDKPVPEGTKHGVYTYKVYRCHCEICVAANAEQRHRQHNPWMYRETRGRWVEEGGVTRLCWPPRGVGPDWQCPHEEVS